MNTRNAAHRAWDTRRARDAFMKKYGHVTYNTVKYIKKGILNDFGEPWLRRSHAATKANLNRSGVFKDMAEACRF